MENGVAERAGSAGAAALPAGPGRVARVSIAVALIIAADQATKSLAVARWSEQPLLIVGSHVQLLVTRNSGSAFSRFQAFTPLLAIGAFVIAIVLARATRTATDRVTLCALVLLLGGALGNLTDRLVRSPGFLHGRVVDFVQIGWYPVFNLADSCITIGAVLLVWRGLFPPKTAPDATAGRDAGGAA